ncbi:MAG: hypothetical protein SH850_15825 [Planctomycetaceae bacterium]|nr:hypothetical protein [Planctomycetaceae bacterium]
MLVALVNPLLGDDLPEDRGAQIYVMNADGTNVRRLGGVPAFRELGSPSYSPDGSHVVVDAYESDAQFSAARLLVLDAEGKNPVDLGPGHMPSWSPDGAKLACSRMDRDGNWRGVGILDLNNREFRKIAEGAWGIEWSPQGDYVVYLKNGVVIHELATGNEHRPLANHPEGVDRLHWNMAVSPDGRKMCGKLVLDAGQKHHAVMLMDLFPAPGADPTPPQIGVQSFVRNREVWADFAWHPTEPRVVFPMRSPEHNNTFLLYEFDPAQPDSLKLVSGQPLDRWNQCSTWRPDGKQLLFLSKHRAKP